MFLRISTTHQPATDLGYLMHKHPARAQEVKLSHGKAHIFYPEASEKRTSICLLLDIDPIEMVRGVRKLSGKKFALGHYVNDRPYVASSFMSVAIAKSFSTALNGTCTAKPELVEQELPFEIEVAVVSAAKGGEMLIRKLFEPLGYKVNLERHVLDSKFEDWGKSKYYTLKLSNNVKTKDLLSHLYVLLPALDFDKHYYISRGEVDKLLDKGKDWLGKHPEREQIVNRYLKNFRSLSRMAMEGLSLAEEPNEEKGPIEIDKPRRKTLHELRLKRVCQELVTSGAKRVLDLGCGEGKLIQLLLKQKQFTEIVGTDISHTELNRAKDRLHWENMAPKMKERIRLFQSALTYRDKRLHGFDAAALVEVIEHLEEDRLEALEKVIFGIARPKTVIVTTPNSEYNEMYETLAAGDMRHTDHRFEWTRAEFANWGDRLASDKKYSVSYHPLGEEEENIGAPSQMAVFVLEK